MPASRPVVTDKAPSSKSPILTQAHVFNNLVFTSGSIGRDPVTGKVVEGTVGDRTTQALKNLSAILEEAGSNSSQVLKVTVFVTNIKDVPVVNEAYVKFFKEPRPARSCVAVKELAVGTDVEIECVGYINEKANL